MTKFLAFNDHNKLSNCPLSIVDSSHKLQNSCVCPLIDHKNSQWAREKICSYRRKTDLFLGINTRMKWTLSVCSYTIVDWLTRYVPKAPSILRRKNLITAFTLKTHQLKTQQSPAILDLRKTCSGKSPDCLDAIVSRTAPFSKRFPSTRKRKADVFRFLRFEARFSKSSVFVTD